METSANAAPNFDESQNKMKANIKETKERLQRQQQVLQQIEKRWQELDERLKELESRLPVLPETTARDEDLARKPR
jgi:chromosome segregation ATPase